MDSNETLLGEVINLATSRGYPFFLQLKRHADFVWQIKADADRKKNTLAEGDEVGRASVDKVAQHKIDALDKDRIELCFVSYDKHVPGALISIPGLNINQFRVEEIIENSESKGEHHVDENERKALYYACRVIDVTPKPA